MKRIILLLAILSLPAYAAFPNGYSFCKVITVKTNSAGLMSGSSNFIDFPVQISFTDADLKVVGSGGLVQSASGFDIIFDDSTACSGTGTLLNWDQERWVSGTGEVIYHARFGTLHFASDDHVSMYYGKSGVVSFQGNTNAAWNSAYKGVWHLIDVANVIDSTGNSSCGAGCAFNSPTNQTGQIDGAMGTGSGAFVVGGSVAALQSITFTYSAWVFFPSAPSGRGAIVGCAAASGCPQFGNSGTNLALLVENTTFIVQSSGGLTSGAWTHVAATYDSSGNFVLYINGVNVASGANLQSFFGGPWNFTFGWAGDGISAHQGNIDEIRFSNIVRTPDWIATEYRGGNSPSTYIAEGSRQTGPNTSVKHRAIVGN